MKIVIAGAGDMGTHLAKLLSIEAQEITIIDKYEQSINYALSHLDLAVVGGDSTHISTLLEANVSESDLFIAATSSESANITTSILAKKLGAKKVIARLSSTDFIDNSNIIKLNDLGIDNYVIPELLAAKEIQRLLMSVVFTDIFKFSSEKLQIVGVHITKECLLKELQLHKINELTKKELQSNIMFTTVAVQRGSETIIPRGDTIFKVDDHAYFLAVDEGIQQLTHLCHLEKRTIKNVMLLGGSRVGINTINQIGDNYNIKLVERDSQKAFSIADNIRSATVLDGDGRSIEFLKENGLEEVDAFIAVTGRTETNIMTCLAAKEYGVEKAIALVENTEYINLSQRIGIDTMINKKLIAANFIFRYVRKGEVLSITTMHGVDAEILEFHVKKGSKIVNNTVKDISFPISAVIGGVVRNNKGYVTLGDFVFQEGDRVVVLTRPTCIHTVESFF